MADFVGKQKRLKMRWLGLLLVLLVLVPGLVLAQTAPGAVPPMDSPGSEFSGGAEGALSFAKYQEDYFLNVTLGTAFSFGKFSFGVQAPLKIRVIDKDPENDQWYREEDWDSASDWTRILRFFQYGSPKDLFYIRIGELVAATVGHGTIVNRYYNTLDLDNYFTGLWTAVNLEYGGLELMTNNVLSWNVFATRAYVRPFTFVESAHPFLKKFAVGTTFAADFAAPSRRANKALTDSSDLESEVVASFWGIDLEWEVLRNEIMAITPYTDFNVFGSLGVGWHLGVLNEFTFAKSSLLVRLEYRLLSAQHGANYFNTLYDIERVTFLPLPQFAEASPNPAVPKYWYHKEATGLKLRNGFYGELFANIGGLFGIGGIYEDYQGPDNANVTLRLDLPAILKVKASAYYTRRNFDGLSELFSLDDAWLVAELRYQFFGPLYAYGLFSRYWREIDDPEGFTAYESTDSYQFGVGASFTF
jgi:hypothetical protein